ncbi:sodium-independent sulfate anion transporter-like isoform X1 [Copidosoma floridanum]|uniref:sodium-independent sulfate anion transporter-like isoform X1 n=2 Tax=Copidosoma floridanum TaxID=29053 RepID=UPI000C6FA8BD|nr:sodium-independent sulfate anion transporter-like isoform X1 [Copidosoma floridanum]
MQVFESSGSIVSRSSGSEMRGEQPNGCTFQKQLHRRLPITAWLPNYSLGKFMQDALAGITVGLTVIPQGIAYADVAGLPPQYGLYSSFMGCFVYMFFGSTRNVTVGPTAIMGLLTHSFVASYGEDLAVLLTFLSGCIITTMGLLHLGFLVDFISLPVISGFTNASAIIIASSQMLTLLGIKGRTDSFLDAIKKLFSQYSQAKASDSVLGICSIVALVVLKNLPGKRRGNLAQKCMWLICLARNAVVVVTGMSIAYSLRDIEPFKITVNITEGLPPFGPPPFTTTHNNVTYNFVDMLQIYGGSVISVPLIALLESIAIAKSFAKGKTLDSSQEMIAVGLCNVFGSFVRSMPTTGSFTRTAVNNASGVKTPFGGLITGCLVLLACGLLTSTLRFIPKATLAAVIIVAMYYMLEIHLFHLLWRTKKIDLIPLLVTLIFCLTAGLDYGIVAGIATNLALLLYGTARPTLLIEERLVNDLPVLLVSPQQSLSFPAAEYLRERVMSWCDVMKNTTMVIIDGQNVNEIDTTVAKNLSLLLSDLEARQQRLIFWNWCDEASRTLIAFDTSIKPHFRTFDNISQLLADEVATSGETIKNESPA